MAQGAGEQGAPGNGAARSTGRTRAGLTGFGVAVKKNERTKNEDKPKKGEERKQKRKRQGETKKKGVGELSLLASPPPPVLPKALQHPPYPRARSQHIRFFHLVHACHACGNGSPAILHHVMARMLLPTVATIDLPVATWRPLPTHPVVVCGWMGGLLCTMHIAVHPRRV